jgi:predicted HTH domain antitoxin
MAKAQKTVSIRLEADDYNFLRSLAEADKEDLSTAVRDLVGRGRVLLALERYRDGKASLSKTAEVAGLSVSEMMDVLAEHGIASDLRVEDYRESLQTLRQAW